MILFIHAQVNTYSASIILNVRKGKATSMSNLKSQLHSLVFIFVTESSGSVFDYIIHVAHSKA